MATNRTTDKVTITEPVVPETKPFSFARLFNRNGHEKQPAAPVKPQGPPKSVWREYFESAVVTVIMALFGMTFIVQAVKVPTGSMKNTIWIQDHLLVNKFIFGPHERLNLPVLPTRDIKRGDVVVFKFPKDPQTNFVKRVIGLPGETIEYRSGKIYI